MTSIFLFKDRRPNACFRDQIYDPTVDGEAHLDMPKLIPAEGAIVVDRDDDYSLYCAVYIDPITFATTLEPTRLVKNEIDNEVGIVSYGNDLFMLYYDDRVEPTQLHIDGKLRLFGSSLAEYRLSRKNLDGSVDYISTYVDASDHIKGERVPVASLSPGSPIKYCTNCHTLHTLQDGEQIVLEVFNNEGILMVSVILFVKRAVFLNDLLNTNTIITGMTATANQMDGDDFYLYQRQQPDELVISPIVSYSDGNQERLSIDNESCFCYGSDEFIPIFPGQKQKVLIKKFLGRKQTSPLQKTDGIERFISIERWVTVLANESLAGLKISIVPIWNALENKYDLKFIGYSDRRDKIYDLTNKVTPLSEWSTGMFNTFQDITFSVDLTEALGTAATVEHRQKCFVKFKHYNEFERWVMKDSETDNYAYGVEAPNRRRPVIHYDHLLKVFFIPTSRFENKEAFIEAFYTVARPPYDPETEISAITPTHFTIRDINDLHTIITSPIPVEEYTQFWNINRQTPESYVGSSFIVEFLQKVGDTYLILYGVPVDIYQSPTGYNTELNP